MISPSNFLAKTMARSDFPDDVILDGEIVAWRQGRALPFSELQKRLGRKTVTEKMMREVPVCYVAFDVLYAGGELVIDTPLRERHALLDRIFAGASHQLKAGFEWWIGWGTDGLRHYQDALYRYRNNSAGVPVPYELVTYNTPLDQKTHMRNIAIFAQDRMTFDRFTLSLGLRYAYYDGYLPEQTGGGGLFFPRVTYARRDPGYAWRTWAPRLGVIYKATDDGRNVAKASYGRYFNHPGWKPLS